MSLIDTTYFVRDINVPLSSNNALNETFTNAIARYEDEILKALLGYTLWKQFKDGLEETSPAQKWLDLRDGAEFSYTLFGHTISTKWNGLVNDDKISLIAYYVYYKHRANTETFYTGLGEKKAKGENSIAVSPVHKLVWAYNSMIDLYGALPGRVRQISTFLNADNYVHYNDAPSAYNFLLANKANYTGWVFKPLKKVNAFGI